MRGLGIDYNINYCAAHCILHNAAAAPEPHRKGDQQIGIYFLIAEHLKP